MPLTYRFCSSPDGILHYSKHELVWSPSGIAQAIAIVPLHHFNPKTNSGVGGWAKSDSYIGEGQRRDMFYRYNQGWLYLGTYECFKLATINFEQLKMFGSSVCAIISVFKYGFNGSLYVSDSLYKRTVRFSELVPPFLQNMVQGMYAVGALRTQGIALRRIGFNHDLYMKLLQTRKGGMTGNLISIPRENHSKRCFADEGEDETCNGRKRRKMS